MAFLPIIKPQRLIKIVQKQGFMQDRQSGSHAIFIHFDGRRITIPIHAKTLGKGLLRSIIKDMELTPEEFKKLV